MAKESWEEAVREFRRAKEIDGGNHEANDGLHRAEAALKQSKVKDYYKILGECADNESCVKVVYLLVSGFVCLLSPEIPRNADDRDIKRAYRKKALEWHPDKVTEVNMKLHPMTCFD
jgi:hypothetical protein